MKMLSHTLLLFIVMISPAFGSHLISQDQATQVEEGDASIFQVVTLPDSEDSYRLTISNSIHKKNRLSLSQKVLKLDLFLEGLGTLGAGINGMVIMTGVDSPYSYGLQLAAIGCLSLGGIIYGARSFVGHQKEKLEIHSPV